MHIIVTKCLFFEKAILLFLQLEVSVVSFILFYLHLLKIILVFIQILSKLTFKFWKNGFKYLFLNPKGFFIQLHIKWYNKDSILYL